MQRKLSCVILAGGVEHRFSDAIPRVLQPLSGTPVVGHVVEAAEALGIDNITVVSNAKGMKEYLGSRGVSIFRDGSRGSGDALLQAKSRIESYDGDVLVLYGDRPFLKPSTLENMITEATKINADCAFLSVIKNKPHGHARVMRDATGAVFRTGRDCEIKPQDGKIREVVAGAYYLKKEALLNAFQELKPEDLIQFYVTDITTWLASQHKKVLILSLADEHEAEGIYSADDLARGEDYFAAMREPVAAGK